VAEPDRKNSWEGRTEVLEEQMFSTGAASVFDGSGSCGSFLI